MRTNNIAPAVALLYLGVVAGIVWGFAMGKYEVFPFPLVKDQYQEVVDFIAGDQAENTTVLEKLQNDFGSVPFRYLRPRVQPNRQEFELHDVDAEPGLFAVMRQPPQFFSAVNHGYYLLYGAFEFEGNRFGAMLIDSQGRITRTWRFDLLTDDLSIRKGGFDPLSGTLISNLSSQLDAQDFCGKPLWRKMNLHSHHSIEPDNEGAFWSFDSLYFEKRDVANGDLKQRFSVIDIMKANPELHVLEPRLKHTWSLDDLDKLGKMREVDLPRLQEVADPFHFNDISPLTADLAPYFPQFRQGDLLISANLLNLVMVVRPENQKILWYRYGLTGQQHDPDFNADGEITVYNNNAHGRYSSIDSLDIDEQKSRVLFSGEALNVHDLWQGNYTVLDDQSIVVVDSAGRVFHVDRDGNVLFYLDNAFNEKTSLEVRNVWYLSDDLVQRFEAACQ